MDHFNSRIPAQSEPPEEQLPAWPPPVGEHVPAPQPPRWSAKDRARVCGCGNPGQHSDDSQLPPFGVWPE